MKHLACTAALILALAGCASIVKKPEATAIKKISIISLYANQKIGDRKGHKGFLKGWTQAERSRIADDAMHIFEAEISSTLAWDVYPAEKVLRSEVYQAAFRPFSNNEPKARAVSNLPPDPEPPLPEGYFQVNGMLPILMDDEQLAKVFGPGEVQKMNALKTIGNFAADLDVDGVAIIQIDLTYKSKKDDKGKPEAVGSAATSMQVIDRRGNLVVDMPFLSPGSSRNLAESKTTIPVYHGELRAQGLATETIHNMFVEAIRASAQNGIGRIKRALQ